MSYIRYTSVYKATSWEGIVVEVSDSVLYARGCGLRAVIVEVVCLTEPRLKSIARLSAMRKYMFIN